MKRKNETLEHGDRVEVYRNLHNNTFSIRLLRPRLGRGDYSRWKLKGKVIKHLEPWQSIFLRNVKFAVQPAGREKVRSEGRKNVHAFVRGTVILPSSMNCTTDEFKENMPLWVTYNPYQNDSFITTVTYKHANGGNNTLTKSIYKANLVTLTQGYVYASL